MAESRSHPFFTEEPAKDPAYISVRDDPHRAHVRERIEQLWARYRPYCPDRHFLMEARRAFHARTWEMYLAVTLLQHGFELERAPPAGPDILFTLGGRRVWVEAVTAERGTGPDAVEASPFVGWKEPEFRGPAQPPGDSLPPEEPDDVEAYQLDADGFDISEGVSPEVHFQYRSEEPFILRYTSVLETKRRKYEEDVHKGVVGPDDCFIIAVNGARLDLADGWSDVPEILKAVLPIGPEMFIVPLGTGGPVTAHFPFRDAVARSPKGEGMAAASVPTRGFLLPDYAGVSGVFFSATGVVNTLERIGDELLFVHNPNARQPLLHGTFRFGREYWVDVAASELRGKDWRQS